MLKKYIAVSMVKISPIKECARGTQSETSGLGQQTSYARGDALLSPSSPEGSPDAQTVQGYRPDQSPLSTPSVALVS